MTQYSTKSISVPCVTGTAVLTLHLLGLLIALTVCSVRSDMTVLNVHERAYIRTEIIRLVGRLAHKVTRDEEPLDGDETEAISIFFLAELDYIMGNITEEERDDRRKTSGI